MTETPYLYKVKVVNLPYRGIMLSDLIIEYNRVQQEIKALEKAKKQLKSQIDLTLSSMGESHYENTHYSAVMSSHQRIKYDTEGLLGELLNRGFSQGEIATPKLDLKKIEVLVAQGYLDPSVVTDFAHVKDIKTLTVKEK